MSQTTKFPYLLPPRHHFTALIINDVHIKLYHAGINSIVTAIRQDYWIPAARQCVKSALRCCTPCKRQQRKPYMALDPASLPHARTQDLPPFTVTGIDFTGALYVQQGSAEVKVYICLFTCAMTRAIHLEVVTDLSTEIFLLAFRRFTNRKGLPHTVICDNVSTYLSVAKELTKLFNSIDLKTTLSRQGVTWKFIPKSAPWYGGF